MAPTRPRRSLQAIAYKEMLNSDSEETKSTESDSELSDESDSEESASPDTVSYYRTSPQSLTINYH